jgi:hypothetical protein
MADISRNWQQHRASLIADLPGIRLDGTGAPIDTVSEGGARLSGAEAGETALHVGMRLITALDELVDEVDRLRDEVDELRSR